MSSGDQTYDLKVTEAHGDSRYVSADPITRSAAPSQNHLGPGTSQGHLQHSTAYLSGIWPIMRVVFQYMSQCQYISIYIVYIYYNTHYIILQCMYIYIHIYITLRFTWATQSSELLADNNSQRNLLSNRPGNRYNGLSDSWDSALPASLFSGSLLSNSPKKTHQSSVNAVTPCNRMQWLYVIINHCCAQLWMQRGETGKNVPIRVCQGFPVVHSAESRFNLPKNGDMRHHEIWNIWSQSEFEASKNSEICRHHPRSAASVLMESDSAQDGGTTWNNNITKHQNVQSSLNILRTCLRVGLVGLVVCCFKFWL